MKKSSREILLQLSLFKEGNWEKIYRSLTQKEYEQYPETEIEYKGNYLTILDEEYPNVLKQAYRPPFVLFYEGNLDLLKNIKGNLAISSVSGKEGNNKPLVDKLLDNTNYTLVLTGNTLTDEIIAKQTSNPLIIVTGTPLSMVNPVFKRGNYLIISEYPEQTNVSEQNLLFSNRIVAGLCNNLLVLNTKRKSSNLQLVMFALQLGKEVLVVPSSPMETESENNKLIYEGATPVWTKEGLCEIMS